ncbi:Ig-like domain-containing protein [Parachryseolinea silvisoli]|uniref:Ig-like domain-containing protein n=1 Tax=Parachryseolinea silvisoli TaxID=2873601 RepID=UPI002265CF8D|nr:hypothetical protein [Parachryseolinea silvisoli]MCD9020183.1 hypothetical protein [Parachryseolinea silvisoli]
MTGIDRFCDGGSATMSVANPIAGITYSWRSSPAGYSATGPSVTFNNITQSTTFYAKAGSGSCSSPEASRTVLIEQTAAIPSVQTPLVYRKTVIKITGSSFQHYWQSAPNGVDMSRPLENNMTAMTVFTSGDYYIRKYTSAIGCWSASKGPAHVEIVLTPPEASVIQIQKSGYTDIAHTIPDRNHVLAYATYYWVKDASNNPEIIRPYTNGLQTVGGKLSESGTYYLKGRDNATGTWGPTLTLQVLLRGGSDVNSLRVIGYDGTFAGGSEKIVSEAISYYDGNAKLLQSQVKSLSAGRVLATQPLIDRHQRAVGSTLSAPILPTDFSYVGAFVLDPSGNAYDYRGFDWPNPTNGGNNTVYNPKAVSADQRGTLGWYYSANNNLEEHVPATAYPYARTEYYDDGTDEVLRSAGVGEALRLGSGHEPVQGTFPVFNELDQYLALRRIAGVPDGRTNNSLRNEASQLVTRDAHGVYSITMADGAGKVLLSALAGDLQEHALAVPVSASFRYNYDNPSADIRPRVYFYLLNSTEPTLTGGGTYQVVDMLTNKPYAPVDTDGNGKPNWLAGFYRIDITAGWISLNYTNYYKNVSCNIYDYTGHVISNVSPNGFEKWMASAKQAADYATIDKSTYKYNYQGWLVTSTEPDAGRTNYLYRKDGKIRFSQNAQQAAKNRFSYTHYDVNGVPVESGEYTGTMPFVPADSPGFATSAIKAEIEKVYPVGDWDIALKKFWVKTYYTFAHDDFGTITNLTAKGYKQQFVRGAVAWSENENMQTWYSYDESGRVVWMAQKARKLPRVFVVKYKYDFLGNVLVVSNLTYDTNGTLLEQFYHHYTYDADRRLSKAFTSTTETGEKYLRATYQYYLHGPLKRIELGNKTQGLDFVYNIQGWLRQINHPDPLQDPGGDTNDAFGMVLDYYESDMNNLFPTAGAVDPYRSHQVPETLRATAMTHAPLLRFLPEPHAGVGADASSFEHYSADNPVYKQMLQRASLNPANR